MKVDIDSLEKNINEMNEKITSAQELINKLNSVDDKISKSTNQLTESVKNLNNLANSNIEIKDSVIKTIEKVNVDIMNQQNKILDSLTNLETLLQKELNNMQKYISNIDKNVKSSKEDIEDLTDILRIENNKLIKVVVFFSLTIIVLLTFLLLF